MKSWYGNIEKEEEEIKLFPPLDAKKCTAEANALFKPYLFFHRDRDTIELWSSCCNKHEVMERIPRVIDSVTSRIVYGEHNYEAICPFCGRAVTLKNTAHLGKRKNLLEYQPVLWLRERDGKLYARAMWARKDYQGALDAPPLFCDTYAYAFEEGRVQSYYIWGNLRKNEISGNYDPRQTEIREPFMEGSNLMAYYVGYHVFGLSEIYKSPFFRYCQYDSYEREWSDGTRGRLIKEKEEVEKARAEAERERAETAELLNKKCDEYTALNEVARELREQADSADERIEKIRQSAEKDKAALEKQLATANKRRIEAEEQVRQAENAEMQAKAELDALRKNPEIPPELIAKAAEEKTAAAKEEAEAYKTKVEELNKALSLSCPEAAVFKAYFEQVQLDFNRLMETLEKVRDIQPDLAEKFERAVMSVVNNIKQRLENEK